MKFINLLVLVALTLGGLHLHAQEFGVEYTSELQTNFRAANFVNLLRLDAEIPFSNSFAFEASTISIVKSRNDRLVDDLQIFSNIEEVNLPFALAVCGAKWLFNDRHSLFLGVRNMNEDYFSSPVSSFFTNSSCGIYPTISANYPIANYPVASVGIHYSYVEGPVKVQASLYNGSGHNRLSGSENVFRFCPSVDGLFALAQIQYDHCGSSYFLGNSIYCNKSTSLTPWFYAEQKLSPALCLLVCLSHAFSSAAVCNDFAGLGLYCHLSKCALGIFSDYANFDNANEFATELSFKFSPSQQLFFQPILHLISSSSPSPSVRLDLVASLRMGLSL